MGAAARTGEIDPEAARYGALAPGAPLIESLFVERFAAEFYPEPVDRRYGPPACDPSREFAGAAPPSALQGGR